MIALTATLAAIPSPAAPLVSAMAPDGHGGAVVAWVMDANGEKLEMVRFDPAHPVARVALATPLAGAQMPDSITAVALDVDEHGTTFLTWQTAARNTSEPSATVWAQSFAPDGRAAWEPVVVARNTLSAMPSVVADGRGGAYVAFGVDSAHSLANDAVEIRHVNAEGSIEWVRHFAAQRAHFRKPKLVTDTNGGVIVVFEARLTDGTSQGVRHLLAQRLSPEENVVWLDDAHFVALAATNYDEHDAVLVPDSGGVIAVFESTIPEGPYAGDINIAAQRITAEGAQVWGSNGTPRWVSATTAIECNPTALSDGRGGVIVSFEGRISETANRDIWAQRIAPTGALLWGSLGLPVALTSTPEAEHAPRLALTGDGDIAVGYTASESAGTAVGYVNLISVDGYYLWPHAWPTQSIGDSASLAHLWAGREGAVNAIVEERTQEGSVALVHQEVNENGVVPDRLMGATPVAGEAEHAPEFALPPSPNPFNATTTFSYWSVSGQHTHVLIVNALGQTVRHIIHRTAMTGWQRVAWDGCDDAGASLASGTYLYLISRDDAPETHSASRPTVGRITLVR